MIGMHDDGGRSDWPCQTSTTGLVDSGHDTAALAMEGLLERAIGQNAGHRKTAPGPKVRGLSRYFDFLTSFMRAALPVRSRRK
jgi:hypothetical protein